MPPQSSRQGVTWLLAQAALLFLFVSCVICARAFKPDASGFEQQGSSLLLYHLSRLGLVFFVTILCYTAGYRALELLRIDPSGLFDSARRTFILCFFFGASLYGIVFTVLGLAGLIGIWTGLVSTIPVLLICRHPFTVLAGKFLASEANLPASDTNASRPIVWFVIMLASAAALAFLLTRVVYIAVFDPNIWEHYSHYYRAILASGSTQPNEIWHHFYASKGAGLIFLTSVLSDFLGAQIASACFALAAGIVVVDLLLEYCESASWAFFGAMLYFAFLYGGVTDGATFKHHLVILGYASFALWGVVLLQQAAVGQVRALMIAMLGSLCYVGFYFPVMAVILPAAFALVALANLAFRVRTHALALFALACSLLVGSGLAFATNWMLTGLIEVTPMRWLWPIADQTKAEGVFGIGGIEFFLRMNNDLRAEYDWSLRRTWGVLRYPLSEEVVYWGLLGLFIVLAVKRTRAAAASAAKFLAYLVAFVLPLSIFAQAVQTLAVDRLALYSIVLMTLATVVILKKLVDSCVGPEIWRAPGEVVASEEHRSHAGTRTKVWHVASVAIMVLGMISAITQAWKAMPKQQRPIIYQFVTGAISLKDAFQLVESKAYKAEVGMSVAAMSAFRKTHPGEGRILRLSYEGGFAYALPGKGMVSEPTYSLIRNPAEILSARPDAVARYLRERNIRYFSLNLKGRLFSTIAFSSLFDVHELPKYFNVAHEDGDVFMLSWRENIDSRPLPDYLLTMLEFKRTAVLHYPFTERFAARLAAPGNDLISDLAGFERIRSEFEQELAKAFATEMLPLVSMKSSKTFLNDILNVAKESLAGANPEMVGIAVTPASLRRTLDAAQGRSWVTMVEKVRTRDVQAHLLTIVRDAIREKYRMELGGRIAGLFEGCDERIPFAIEYPVDAVCNG